MRKRCATCSAPVEQKTLPVLSVDDATLRLTVEGMPAAICPEKHASPIDNDFMLWLIHALKERAGAVPAAQEKGLLMFKKYYCACGRQLPAQPGKRQAFDSELAYEGAPPFKAGLEVPLYRCEGCGKEQLRSSADAQKRVAFSVAALNDAAKFPHSG